MNVKALRLSPEFADFIREGYSQYLFYGEEGEWTKNSRIEAKDEYFWRRDRVYVSRRLL
jgi:hypothetical protein